MQKFKQKFLIETKKLYLCSPLHLEANYEIK